MYLGYLLYVFPIIKYIGKLMKVILDPKTAKEIKNKY